jgi:hypothetical protein
LGIKPADELSNVLIKVLLDDAAEAVRREAAASLVALDCEQHFVELIGQARTEPRAKVVEALAHVRVAADTTRAASSFEEHFRTLDRRLRSRIVSRAWRLRFQRGLPTLFLVLVPTLVLSSATSAPFKFIPGSLNYALAQGRASGAAGIFQGVLATFLWGGVITLCIALHAIVFSSERKAKSSVRPWGALAAGALGGVISSALVLAIITRVCSSASVEDQGWADVIWEKNFHGFWDDILWKRRYFWPYMIMGPGLGLGMAMMANGVQASEAWRRFLGNQTALTASTVLPMVAALVKRTWRFAWPIAACLLVADAIAFFILRDAPGAVTVELSSWNDRLLGGLTTSPREWKMSAWGQGLSIAFDSITQGLGGFFCIIGMALGLLAARRGVSIEPRRN